MLFRSDIEALVTDIVLKAYFKKFGDVKSVNFTDTLENFVLEGARDEIRAIVTRAFNTDKEGQINRSEIFMLLRLEIEDPRWLRAMKAIRDAMRVVGSKTYVRCYRRDAFDAPWAAVSIDLAKV